MTRRTLASGAKACFGIALLLLLAAQVDTAELSALLRRGDPRDLMLSCALFCVALGGFQALRLHVLVRDYTGSAAVSWKLFFVGALFNNLLPSNVGGDAVRLLYLRRMRAESWGEPFALLFLHRISGLGVLLVAGALVAALDMNRLLSLLEASPLKLKLGAGPVLLGAGLLLSALLFVSLSRRAAGLRVKLQGFAAGALRGLRRVTGPQLGALLLLTCAFHGCRILAFQFALGYLGHSMSAADLILVLTAAAVAALLPVSIAGLGVMEGSIVLLMGLFGVPTAAATAAALIHRAALLAMALVGGLIYLREPARDSAAGDSHG